MICVDCKKDLKLKEMYREWPGDKWRCSTCAMIWRLQNTTRVKLLSYKTYKEREKQFQKWLKQLRKEREFIELKNGIKPLG